MQVKVKICGVKGEEALEAVLGQSPDAVGFVVLSSGSPRNLAPEEARRLMSRVPPLISRVMVTASKELSEIARLANALQPDALQPHSLNDYRSLNALRKEFSGKIIGVVPVEAGSANSPSDDEGPLQQVDEIKSLCDAVLLDARTRARSGGLGLTINWELARLMREKIFPHPTILAGGLSPHNVEAAIRAVRPFAVDVSSGVEKAPGVKDPARIREFIKRARAVSFNG